MSDDQEPDSGLSEDKDPVATWREACGEPLQNALRWIEAWRHEARDGDPREITYQEFTFRCSGDLKFDGEAYDLTDGLEGVIAKMGTPGLLRVTSVTESDEDLGPIPRLGYELACHVAKTNKLAGRQLPRALGPYASDIASPVKRKQGQCAEDRQLFRTLAWWGVDRGVGLGLKQGKNRSDAARKPREGKQPSAAELVVECFKDAGWKSTTYNTVNDAWQGHRHQGGDQRKLVVKSHDKVYENRFEEIDQLLQKLPAYPGS